MKMSGDCEANKHIPYHSRCTAIPHIQYHFACTTITSCYVFMSPRQTRHSIWKSLASISQITHELGFVAEKTIDPILLTGIEFSCRRTLDELALACAYHACLETFGLHTEGQPRPGDVDTSERLSPRISSIPSP